MSLRSVVRRRKPSFGSFLGHRNAATPPSSSTRRHEDHTLYGSVSEDSLHGAGSSSASSSSSSPSSSQPLYAGTLLLLVEKGERLSAAALEKKKKKKRDKDSVVRDGSGELPALSALDADEVSNASSKDPDSQNSSSSSLLHQQQQQQAAAATAALAPYVVLSHGKYQYVRGSVKDSAHPVWKEHFALFVESSLDGKSPVVNIEVFHQESAGPKHDRPIGIAHLLLDDLLASKQDLLEQNESMCENSLAASVPLDRVPASRSASKNLSLASSPGRNHQAVDLMSPSRKSKKSPKSESTSKLSSPRSNLSRGRVSRTASSNSTRHSSASTTTTTTSPSSASFSAPCLIVSSSSSCDSSPLAGLSPPAAEKNQDAKTAKKKSSQSKKKEKKKTEDVVVVDRLEVEVDKKQQLLLQISKDAEHQDRVGMSENHQDQVKSGEEDEEKKEKKKEKSAPQEPNSSVDCELVFDGVDEIGAPQVILTGSKPEAVHERVLKRGLSAAAGDTDDKLRIMVEQQNAVTGNLSSSGSTASSSTTTTTTPCTTGKKTKTRISRSSVQGHQHRRRHGSCIDGGSKKERREGATPLGESESAGVKKERLEKKKEVGLSSGRRSGVSGSNRRRVHSAMQVSDLSRTADSGAEPTGRRRPLLDESGPMWFRLVVPLHAHTTGTSTTSSTSSSTDEDGDALCSSSGEVVGSLHLRWCYQSLSPPPVLPQPAELMELHSGGGAQLPRNSSQDASSFLARNQHRHHGTTGHRRSHRRRSLATLASDANSRIVMANGRPVGMFGLLSVVPPSVGIEQYRTLASQTAHACSQIRDGYGFVVERCLVANADYWAWLERKQRATVAVDKTWLSFVRKHGLTDFDESALRQLQKMARGGIPDALRAELWQVCSREALLERPYYYRHIGKTYETLGIASPMASQIEKDLLRTFPGHPLFLRRSGIASLRRLLTLYSRYNTNVGYCQSLNFLAGFLLLYMPEENVFWVLDAIVRRLLPNYFNIELTGVKADCHVLTRLVEQKLPKLAQHFEEHNINLFVVALRWFLQGFVGVLPTRASLRVLDLILLNINDTLFRIALSMLKIFEPQMLQVHDDCELLQMVQNLPSYMFDSDQLIQLAFDKTLHVKLQVIEKLRVEELSTVESKFKQKIFSTLQQVSTSSPNPTDMEALYRQLKSAGSANDDLMEYAAFSAFHMSLGFSEEESEMAFRAFDTNNDGSVSFKELFVGYAIMFGGSVDDKIQMCFRAFDRDGDDRLCEEEVEELLSFLYQISCCVEAGTQTVRRRKRFSKLLVKAVHETDSRSLDLKQFRAILESEHKTLTEWLLLLSSTNSAKALAKNSISLPSQSQTVAKAEEAVTTSNSVTSVEDVHAEEQS
mmetsp:Transcript_709/g.2188  ORF Transcript_709/g.2188 Transcript_709/m.2188 type:complete len:1367 (-) Transcript_709:3815-7915(-)|eukprot:CAMPEP_0174232570 /NCGR_PEP_ID=MMETSP0417-20130205/2818_1 /TAXON_ID=242541 /ORGANISM="Mayorella sp, Strain BSH-02190019" /LENGTH=1366 /DNA_ID=CAMNT_0015310641 /DNA_START=131 /DNA_END=4231 /DNA_ORIENTATION=-